MDGLQKDTECTLQLLDYGLSKINKLELRLLIMNIFRKLGDTLSVSVGLKLGTSLDLKESFQFFEVGDDTIVHNGEFPIGIRSVRMTVEARRWSVGGPSGVCDTDMAFRSLAHIKTRSFNKGSEFCDFSHLLEGKGLAFVAIDNKTCRIIPSVFESCQSYDLYVRCKLQTIKSGSEDVVLTIH